MMNEEDFQDENLQLDKLFQQYRSACPEVEPRVNFMPVLWQKIEGRRTLWFHFGQLGKNAVAFSAALCILLLALNLASPPQVGANYADALLSDDSAQQVYFSEAIAPNPPENEVPGAHQ